MILASPPRPRRLAPMLAALAMFGPFSIDTMFPAFPAIAKDLGASALAMQQTLSVYIVAYALTALLHGPLSDAFGRRRVILGGVGVFVFASIGCALAGSIGELLVFRALQGMSAGVGFIVGRAIIRDCFVGADAQRLMATVSMIFGVAPAIAPIVGGWVIAFARWPMIFWLLAAFATVLWITCVFWLPETHLRENRVALSPRAMLTNYRRIVSDRCFLPLALAGTLGFNALFVYIASAPAFVIGVLGLDEQQFAWLFIPAIGGLMLGSFVSARLAGRISAPATVRFAYAVMLGAATLNLGVAVGLPEPAVPWSVLPIGLHAVGIGIVMPTLTLMLLDRFPQFRGSVSSLQTFVSLAGSALLAGLISPLISDSAVKLAATAALITAAAPLAWLAYRVLERRPGSAGAQP